MVQTFDMIMCQKCHQEEKREYKKKQAGFLSQVDPCIFSYLKNVPKYMFLPLVPVALILISSPPTTAHYTTPFRRIKGRGEHKQRCRLR